MSETPQNLGLEPAQATRTIDTGDDVATVTVEVTAPEPVDATVFESVAPAADEVEIVDADGADLAGTRDDGLFATYGDRTDVTLVYEVAIDDATSYEFEGSTNTNASSGSLDQPTAGDERIQADGSTACVDGASAAEVDGHTVCDLNGDGNYRDLTASGDTTVQDLQFFFERQHREPWNSRTDLFDYTGNGDVGQPDVVDLFHAI